MWVMGRDPLTIVYTDAPPAPRTHAVYLSAFFFFFFPQVKSGAAREVSKEHEGELIDEERVDAAKRGFEGHVTRDNRRAGINVDGDADRR